MINMIRPKDRIISFKRKRNPVNPVNPV